jgi:hypothetical protein
MTRRRVLIVAAFVTAVLATAAVVQWSWLAAPDVPLEVIPAIGEDPESVQLREVDCTRTLPDAPDDPAAETVTPVGRVSSAAINSCPDAFDQQVVVYVGEAVGDILQRDGGAWALVNDDEYALAVGPLSGHREFGGGNSGLSIWLPDAGGQSRLVDEPGNATRRGDVIEVRGVVHRTDPADGGGLTIRALQTRVLVEAQYLDTRVNRVQAGVAVVLGMLALGVVVWDRRLRRRG